MKHPPLPATVSFQRPVRSTGGGEGGGGGGGGAAASGGGSGRLEAHPPSAAIASKTTTAFAAGPLYRIVFVKPDMSRLKTVHCSRNRCPQKPWSAAGTPHLRRYS